MTRIDVVTLFPGMFPGVLDESMLRVAQERKAVDIRVVDLRNYAEGRHRVADDYPFGGGGGMVLKPEPLFAAVDALRGPESRVVLLCPQGPTFTQATAERLARVPHLVLLCGHYEGVDERVRAELVDEELSIGDYVVTGGSCRAGRAGRGGAARAGRSRRSRGRGPRVLCRGPARLPAVHAARRVPRCTGCRRSSCPGTTAASPSGGGARRSGAPSRAGRTSWRRCR